MRAIVGDLHAEFQNLENMIEEHPEWSEVTIVGDIGLGFPGTFHVPFKSKIPIKFVRGNHDNPDFIQNLPKEFSACNWHYIPDGTINDGVLYIGGAFSIDRDQRTPGYNWWPNEEISFRTAMRIMSTLTFDNPVIHTVISHEAPTHIVNQMVKRVYPNETGDFLDELAAYHLTGERRPDQWYFGHHHRKFEIWDDGIHYRCLQSVNDYCIW